MHSTILNLSWATFSNETLFQEFQVTRWNFSGLVSLFCLDIIGIIRNGTNNIYNLQQAKVTKRNGKKGSADYLSSYKRQLRSILAVVITNYSSFLALSCDGGLRTVERDAQV